MFTLKILGLEKITGHQRYVPSEFYAVYFRSRHVFNSRYVSHEINTSYVTRRCYVTKKNITNMGLVIIYNDPLNPKVHVFNAMCI